MQPGNGWSEALLFVEYQHGATNYQCYSETVANFSETHRQSVQYQNSNGLWYSFLDGAFESITTEWTPCGGLACAIDAYGENFSGKSGLWYAKFAGSGNTPWQLYNGSWYTIDSTYPVNYFGGTNWSSSPSGPFPTGIWSFTYSH